MCNVPKVIASLHSYRIPADRTGNLSESRHVLKVRDEFSIGGPNGSHCCIVTEVLGPNPWRMRRLHKDDLLPLTMARKTARELAESGEYLHS
jgi:hypothetical protein